MKKIAILGSTGSIGTQALEIVKNNPELFEIDTLTCWKNVGLLEKQINDFSPNNIVVAKEADALALTKKYPKINISFGEDSLTDVVKASEASFVLNGLVGMVGLRPTYEAIKQKKDIALANKETIVVGGKLIIDEVKKQGVSLLPVDSEHSAIFQCLNGAEDKSVKRIVLTASGGPFRGYTLKQLGEVTLSDALKHPNWSMGSKITIDSATMMNKGLEVIETKWLFDVSHRQIDVVIHKESIIHSMVEFIDGSTIAQLGYPEMKVPIQYAFTYPERIKSPLSQSLNLATIGNLSFEEPKNQVFTCLRMAYDVLDAGGSYSIAYNAANEVLVEMYLNKEISFLDIQNNIAKVLDQHQSVSNLSIDDIYALDHDIRKQVRMDIV